MDKLQPYKEIADRIFEDKFAIKSDGNSLTVFFQTCGKEHPMFTLDDGSDVHPYKGFLELRFLFNAFEEFDLSVITNKERAVFGLTFRQLKPDVNVPAVFDYPDESEQRHLEYFDRVLTDFYNPPEYPELHNVNLDGLQRFNGAFENICKALKGTPFSVEEHMPMTDIEDDVFGIDISFGFSTRRVFRFTGENLDALRKGLDFSNDITIGFLNDEEGFIIYLSFGVINVRF